MLKKLGIGKSDKDKKDDKKSSSSAPAASSSNATPVSSSVRPAVTSNGSAPVVASSTSSAPAASSTRMEAPSKPLPVVPTNNSPEVTEQLNINLYAAVVKGAEIKEIKALIIAGADIRYCFDEGENLFITAATKNHPHILQFFADLALQPGQPDITKEKFKDKVTAVELAIPQDALEAIQWLEAHGHDLNTVRQPVLDMASNMGAKRVLDYLRTRITNPNLRVPLARTLPPFANEFYYAAVNANLAALEAIIKKGGDVHKTLCGPDVEPVLHVAARAGKNMAVRWLLENQYVDPTTKNEKGETILFTAAETGNVGLLQLCKQYPKLDPNIRNASGISALAAAARNGHTAAVKCLVEEFGVNIGNNCNGADARAISSAGHKELLAYLTTTGKAQRAAVQPAAAANVSAPVEIVGSGYQSPIHRTGIAVGVEENNSGNGLKNPPSPPKVY